MEAALEQLKSISIDEETNKGSLIDVVVAVTGQNRKRAAETISNLSASTPELSERIRHLRINGSGKLTPVADAATMVEIVWILPGAHAKAFRRECAQVLCSVLSGDLQLAHAIEKQHHAIQGTQVESFLAGDTNASRQLTAHVNTVQIVGSGTVHTSSLLKPGMYIVRYGQRLKLFSNFDSGEVLGFGYTKKLDRRTREHYGVTGDCELLDFFPTYNEDIEYDFKRKLRLKGRLCEGTIDEKNGKITELLWVADQEGYMEVVQEIMQDIADNPHPAERVAEQAILTLQARIAEAQARSDEARAVIVKSETQLAIAQAEARKAEADVLRLQHIESSASITNVDESNETTKRLPTLPAPTEASLGFFIVDKQGRNTAVQQIDINTGEVIKTFDNMEMAGRQVGCTLPKMSLACSSGKTLYGYKWKVKQRWVDLTDTNQCDCKVPCKPTYQFLNDKLVHTWPCRRQIAQKLQKDLTTINKAIKRSEHTLVGYSWYDSIPSNITP